MKKILFIFFVFSFCFSLAQSNENKNKILSSENGRFVFGQVNELRADRYLLDTQTGRLWTIVVDSNKVESLQQIYFLSIDGLKSILPENPDSQYKRYFDSLKKK